MVRYDWLRGVREEVENPTILRNYAATDIVRDSRGNLATHGGGRNVQKR